MTEATRVPVDGDDRAGGLTRRRRWPWVVLVLAVVVAVVVAVLFLANDREPEAAPQPADPEVVTLPVPTPTIDPIDVEPGTRFFESLPRTVLEYALTESTADQAAVASGAVEAYRLVLGDGGTTEVVVLASQWRDADAAGAAFDELLAAEAAAAGIPVDQVGTPTGSADDAAAGEQTQDPAAPTEEPTEPAAPTEPTLEQGPVEVDGTQVGRYLLVTRPDGSGTVHWTNGTALLRLDGPATAVRDVYAAFPL
ncbi:hypothetical protein [Cellulomonas carbonis]|uniref:hypothetical protein n=1 Tax=Cellulomonas carbonis TaxID=1386092 RepID=UPI000A6FB2A9|nr:hypothetical protein [Cellulomonas carbonis]GGC08944.1 hypothetical protein GCM10010972_22800 [Cellulomonas carbonis]